MASGILLPQLAEIQSSDRQRRGPRDRAPVAASRLRRRVEAAAAVRTWFRGQTPEGPLNPTFRTTHRKGPGAMNCMRCCSPSTLDLPSHFLCCLSLNILGPHTRCLSSGRGGPVASQRAQSRPVIAPGYRCEHRRARDHLRWSDFPGGGMRFPLPASCGADCLRAGRSASTRPAGRNRPAFSKMDARGKQRTTRLYHPR